MSVFVCMLMFVCVHMCVSVCFSHSQLIVYLMSVHSKVILASPHPPKKKFSSIRLVQQKTTALQMTRPLQNDQLQLYGHTGESLFCFCF